MNQRFPAKILWLDTETTGLDPSLHDPWQIACVLDVAGVEVAQWECKCAPVNCGNVQEAALKAAGVTLEDIRHLPAAFSAKQSFEQFLVQWCDKFNTKDKLVLAGYNARFDYDMLRAWFDKLGDKYFGSYFFWPVLDVATYVAEWLAAGNRTHTGKATLSDVCASLGIPLKAHDALEDIRGTRTAYQTIKKVLQNGGA